jgi:hypothetical protein
MAAAPPPPHRGVPLAIAASKEELRFLRGLHDSVWIHVPFNLPASVRQAIAACIKRGWAEARWVRVNGNPVIEYRLTAAGSAIRDGIEAAGGAAPDLPTP